MGQARVVALMVLPSRAMPPPSFLLKLKSPAKQMAESERAGAAEYSAASVAAWPRSLSWASRQGTPLPFQARWGVVMETALPASGAWSLRLVVLVGPG